MIPHRRVSRTGIVAVALLALAAAPVLPAAAASPVRTLVPIGSDYQPDTMQLFARQAALHDVSGHVVILVLPITYSLSADSSKNGERSRNLTLAATRTQMMQDACDAVRSAIQTCDAELVPALVRADAYLESNLAFFTPDVDGVFVLGGDQTVAMTLVAGTPLEAKMAEAYASGAAVGGNSAGDAVQSVTMINGYTGSNGPAESMRQGAIDVWAWDGTATDLTRGLIFGLRTAITDQHVFEYGRTGRSLNVALTQHLPVVGMDAATGAIIKDETDLSTVTGDTSGYVIDPLTWGSSFAFGGPNATLSARRVAIQLLAPGGDGYSLATLRPSHDGTAHVAPSIASRAYPAIATPAGAAPVLLSGGIAADPAGPVGQRFATLAGGRAAKIVVLAAGYAKATNAQAAAKSLAAALQPGATAPVASFVLDSRTNQVAVTASLATATGIVLTAPDRSTVMASLAAQAPVMTAVRNAWSSGRAVLLADDAAAAAMGTTFIADGISADVEVSAPLDMLAGQVAIGSGLGWVTGVDVEPRLLPDQNWPQLFRLDAAVPASLAAGVDVGTALEVSGGVATARGASAVAVLDGRKATFGTGTNGSLSARWLVLDSFVEGERLAP